MFNNKAKENENLLQQKDTLERLNSTLQREND